MHADSDMGMGQRSYSIVFDRFFKHRRIEFQATTEIARRADIARGLEIGVPFMDEVSAQVAQLLADGVVRQGVQPFGERVVRYGPGGWQPGDTVIYELNIGNPGVLLELIKRLDGVSFDYVATVSFEGWEPYLANLLGCPTFDPVALGMAIGRLEVSESIEKNHTKLSDDGVVDGVKSKRYGVKYRMTVNPVRMPQMSLATS